MLDGIPWDLRRRGLKDAWRHDERVKEAVRKNLRELIVEESIISSNGDRVVKIPVRYLDQYRFRHLNESGPQGVGQGPGEPGDVIGRGDPSAGGASGPGEGMAGDRPGENVYEAEITVEEIARMMLEDLELPWLEQAGGDIRTPAGVTFDDVRRKGQMANLDRKRTLRENLKRQAAKGRPRLGAFTDEDLRFKVWNERSLPHARAAVYMLMDRSASMTTEKKYIAKSFYFWFTRFLKIKYRQVELVFISHDVEAQVVTEQEFFTISNSGGTRCSSAHRLAREHMREHHPPSSWNNYLFHFTDGENLPEDNELCVELILEHVRACRMVGYGEICYSDYGLFYTNRVVPRQTEEVGPLYRELEKSAAEHENLVLVQLRAREHIYPALRRFLQKDGAA